MRAHAPDDLEGLDREYEHDAGAGQAHGPNGHAEAPILDPRDPLSSAGTFVATFYVHEAGRTVHRHRGGFYSWDGACYCETPDREIRAHLYDFLGQARVIADGRQHHFKPTATRVNDVLDAMKALVHLPDRTGTPSWLDGRPSRTSDLVACRNGLLHLPTRVLHAPTPLFFGLNAVGFDYQPRLPRPAEWERFLTQLWPDDPESIACLQEIFGYALTPDTRLQKAFLIVGPKRSGKGTIARVLKAVLGDGNTAAPTLSGLGTNFGLSPLIGNSSRSFRMRACPVGLISISSPNACSASRARTCRPSTGSTGTNGRRPCRPGSSS